jgi:hypothetical protein
MRHLLFQKGAAAVIAHALAHLPAIVLHHGPSLLDQLLCLLNKLLG